MFDDTQDAIMQRRYVFLGYIQCLQGPDYIGFSLGPFLHSVGF